MANTTNFGWETPDDTDLVKDGAAAMRTLGGAIDTSLVDLKGGTTGQNLRKATNTDMDFTWAGDATNTVIDAEGDLLVGDSADTLQRLAIGTTGQVLTVDTAVDGKIKWAAAASGGMTLLESLSLSGASTTSSSIANTYKHLVVVFNGIYVSGGGVDFTMRFNSDSSTNYLSGRIQNTTGTLTGRLPAAETQIQLSDTTTGSGDLQKLTGHIWIYRYTDVNQIFFAGSTIAQNSTDTTRWSFTQNGMYDNAAAISTITFIASGGTFSGGTAYIYGVN